MMLGRTYTTGGRVYCMDSGTTASPLDVIRTKPAKRGLGTRVIRCRECGREVATNKFLTVAHHGPVKAIDV